MGYYKHCTNPDCGHINNKDAEYCAKCGRSGLTDYISDIAEGLSGVDMLVAIAADIENGGSAGEAVAADIEAILGSKQFADEDLRKTAESFDMKDPKDARICCLWLAAELARMLADEIDGVAQYIREN